MKRPKYAKSILLGAGLTLGLSAFVTVSAYAYTPGITTYTTVSGDSLYKISRVFHTSVDNLMNLNALKGYSLNIGQKLEVPGDTYTAQRGDTMFLISRKYRMPLSELQRANNNYSDKLDVGQQLAVPVSNAATAQTSATTQTPAPTSAQAPSPAPTPAPASTQIPSQAPDPAPAKTEASVEQPKSESSAAYSPEELDLLARLICAEAQGEPYQAKVAIGSVVMNRVESGLFETSIKDVIYQNINGYYQFTPVENGWINKPADTDSINAAKEALNGSDPTGGALWYYDDTSTNQFMLAKKVAVKIGRMVFAY